MPTEKLLPLKALFGGPDSQVADLIKRGNEVDALTLEVKRIVPEPLGRHILTASIRSGTLYLVTDAAVWAARLRYLAADIRTSLTSTQGHSLQKVQVKVRGAGG